MRWSRRGRSPYLEDRRGRGGRMRSAGIPLALGGGVPTIVVLVVALFVLFGGGVGDDGPRLAPPERAPSAGEDEIAGFVEFLTLDVQDVWEKEFAEMGRHYRPATLVLFDQATSTGCGPGSSATGPFYCPLDERIYIDLSFFRQLHEQFGAPGDFAQAYVVAHEFGHHVQNVLGTMDEVRTAQQTDADAANQLSIALELQADCYAGVWGHDVHQRGDLERGDLEEGMNAAAAVGDDRLQPDAPERWTHGSSEQRITWFRRGFDSGDPAACDTLDPTDPD
jgi:uncharacterized protein